MRLISDDAIAIVCIFQEAEGESYEGKVAVAEVIWNRTKTRYSSDGTVVGTCLRAFQFSGWNSASTNRIRSLEIDTDSQIVRDCANAWQRAKEGSNTVKGSVLYYNKALVPVPPAWANPAKLVVEIGHHSFFSA